MMFDELRGWGKPDKLKKIINRTVYGTVNQRRKDKKWRGQCLEVVAMRLVSGLLFTPAV